MKEVKEDIRKCLICIVGILLSFASCVTNEGDIGFFYGQWSLTDMSIDSHKADVEVELYFWKFQNNIIQIQTLTDLNQTNYSIGTWEEKDGVLFLNFTHHDVMTGSENWARFNPPADLGIPGRVISPLEIEKLTSKDMVLRFDRNDGKIYRYTFKKLI